MKEFIPAKGDLVILTFDPQSGHEQKGRRPAIVISNRLFNQVTGLAIVCPITNRDRNIPFHVALPKNNLLTGYIMVEQVKSVDFRTRKVKFVESATVDILNEVLAILDASIYGPEE
ncbi:MAG: type II toxin-antitoxin system PemK/MazF family toxin [Deltaproteobacteria bacterium]|nr:type II toxin-antitoxin system PemK/MazF family toxin [Deltaproteobacteria bacterium]